MRVEVRIHGVVVVLALEKFAGVANPSCQATSVPLPFPAGKLPQLISPLLLLSPPSCAPGSGPYLWGLAKHFLGKRPPSHDLRCSVPDDRARTSVCLA